MPLKFRFYIFLICCCGIVMFSLYKLLNVNDEASTEPAISPLPVISKHSSVPPLKMTLGPLKNVNELLEITQPSHHLSKQKLREAQVHEKIKLGILRKTRPPGAATRKLSSPNESLLEHKLVHLDLKGAPPIYNYYKSFLPMVRQMKATGLLIEYEDMFPYSGVLSDIAAYNAYKRSEVRGILALAKENELEVIPLIQTFGHLEFVLKQAQYQGLREVPEYPQVICPSANKTMSFIKEMIDQIVFMHKGIKWIHIGADEVYYLGRCDRCQLRMQKENLDLDSLFIRHVIDVAKYIKEKHQIQPIMWDDMFRSVSEEYLRQSEIWKYVDLMVWSYTPTINVKLTEEIWDKYTALFQNIWAASAFKGATRSNSIIPNVKNHILNHKSWLEVVRKYKDKIHFKGIALTGWQRYDHFATLCELLPAGIPSLTLNLLYLDTGKMDEEVMERASEMLRCQSIVNITQDDENEDLICDYPGSKAFTGVQRLRNIQNQLHKIKKNSHVVSWITDYHVRHKFASPAHVAIGTRNLHHLIVNTTHLYPMMERALAEVYDAHTTREWLETFIDPIVKEISAIKDRADFLLTFNVWPRRPLTDSKASNTLQHLAILNRDGNNEL